MKVFMFLLFVVIIQISGFSIPTIHDTKETGCVNGRCGDYCVFDDAKVFPGEELNQIGLCRKLYCHTDFTILMSVCSEFDMYDEYDWSEQDNSKPFPKCCGTKGAKKPGNYSDFE
ncbi:CLUMA_CG018082, isoform A [Clunio marinus]|uniref:CLUMA_CG018082, isoform A n=1 Tax=Clunio marinus TaxID=568069 RepID=A0A1J1IY79_9DIPT|nr:CLUMA_CG018082, isoform A [Clunio marinus]